MPVKNLIKFRVDTSFIKKLLPIQEFQNSKKVDFSNHPNIQLKPYEEIFSVLNSFEAMERRGECLYIKKVEPLETSIKKGPKKNLVNFIDTKVNSPFPETEDLVQKN